MHSMVAVLSKKNQNVTKTAVAMLEALESKGSDTYWIVSATCAKSGKSLELLQNMDSPIAIGIAFSENSVQDRFKPLRLNDSTVIFDGEISSDKLGNSDVETVRKEVQRSCADDPTRFVKKNEDNFVFAIAESKKLVAGRDVMGMRPLYYGENADLAALASERKALWRIGIEKVESFPPGYVGVSDECGLKFILAREIAYPKPKQITMQAAAQKLQELLKKSVKEKVSGLNEVAVAFSGGLDSSLIAFLAGKAGVDVQLIHVSLERQPETEVSLQAAEELRLPIHCYVYTEDDVQKVLAKVVRIIEEKEPIDVGIGIPMYWAGERTAEMKCEAMLAGQGADELFGGYRRYVDDYVRFGREKSQETMFSDVAKMYENNLERDFKICNFHDVELRLPFVSYQMARFALSLPLELKIEPRDNSLRKLVLREAAKNLGLPPSIVDKPKKAIQYTTGTNRILQKIARQRGLSMDDYLGRVFEETFRKDFS